MRAIARSADQIFSRQQRLDLALRERIARFHRGLAGHHVEDLVEQFFLVKIEQFLLAALKQLADELGGVELLQKARETLDCDRLRTKARQLDSEATEQRLDLIQQRHLP